jgi:hypothetical protein
LNLAANGPILGLVDKQWLVESHGARWTRVDDYIEAMARKRGARRERENFRPRHPDAPRSVLGTLPFLALITLLGVLAVAIMILAFPGNQPQHKPTPPAQHEFGTADRGWFQEAQKQFR